MTVNAAAAGKGERYVAQLPGVLRRALAAGRWLPIVGAGISATAATEDQRRPPGWAKLAELLATDLPGAVTTNPIDSISAYAETYGRPYLVERLSELLLINDIEPGEVHDKFACLPFDMVVTTNFDFLLEKAYARQRRPCVPLIGESQLSMQREPEATYLLKFHGDVNHPEQLVVTEDDYDGFVRRNPLLATFLSWWLLTREPVFLGYSLDDADFREILTLLRERLGRMTRPAWAILPADPNNQAPKFSRRGIRPIVLDPDPKADRSEVLKDFFAELRTTWEHEIVSQIGARTDATTAELQRRRLAPQLALFVASRPVLALYREFVFPSVPQSGLLPLGLDEVRAQDRAMTQMAIDIALSKAAVVVYDTGRGNPLPLDYVISQRAGTPVLVISGPADSGLGAVLAPDTTPRPPEMTDWPSQFVLPLRDRIKQAKGARPADLTGMLHQLLDTGEHAQLLLACLALLEEEMRSDTANLPTAFPQFGGGRMDELQAYFDMDFNSVIVGVRLRHDMTQGLAVNPSELQSTAAALLAIADARSARRVGTP
jgi:hypothetical protein